jgi:glycosyltransferase 2 family protein
VPETSIHRAKRLLFLALKIGVSIGLLYFIFTLIDVRAALKAALGANFALLALAALIRASVFCFDALRLYWMAPVRGLPYHQHLRLALRGAFFSQLGFGFLTGDAYRAVGYGKGSGSVSESAAHLLAARLAGIAMTAIIALIATALLITADNIELRGFAHQVGIGVFGIGTLSALMLWLGLKILPRFAPPALQHRIAQATRALASLSPRIWALSLLVILLRGLSLWMIFLALHQQISYFVPLLASVTGTLVTLLPLAFGGLGLREGAVAGVATLFGLPAALSVSAAILLRLAVVSAASTGLVISLFMPELEKMPKADSKS